MPKLVVTSRSKIKMDQLNNDVKLLQYWMCETRRDINTVREDVMMQGLCKELFKQLVVKVAGIEEHVNVMADRLEDVIEKFNKLLKKHVKDEEEEEEEVTRTT